MSVEAGAKIGDLPPVACLVECAPAEPDGLVADVSSPSDDSPVAQAMAATIEQTGAGPPPDGDR